VSRDAGDAGLVRYTEEWEREEAFRRHVRSDDFWPVLLAIDSGSQARKVARGEAPPVQGVEVLCVVCGASPSLTVAGSEAG
jgi:hypothetical protein